MTTVNHINITEHLIRHSDAQASSGSTLRVCMQRVCDTPEEAWVAVGDQRTVPVSVKLPVLTSRTLADGLPWRNAAPR